MGTRVRKIVDPKSEDPFQGEAFTVIRTELTPKSPFDGDVRFAVKEAIAHFGGPEKSRLASPEDVRAAIDAIVAKTKTGGDAGDNGRLPLADTAQDEWNRGRDSRWFKAFSIADVRDRFAGKIKAGEEITEADMDALKAEKEAEKAKIAELVDVRKDGPELECASPAHPDNAPKTFQPLAKYRIERVGGTWQRRKHAQGGGFIEYGNFLVVEDQKVPYCDPCRQVAWDVATASNFKVTFHSLAGAERKLSAIAKAGQKQAALTDQLKAAGGRSGGGSRHQGGPRENKVDRLNARFTRRGN